MLKEAIERLKENIIFHGAGIIEHFDEAGLQEALQIIHISQVGPGNIVIKQGDEGDSIILILKGELGVYVKEKSGKEMCVASVGETKFVGEMAIIDEGLRMATVKATTDCILGTIHAEEFWKYFQKFPVLAKNVLRGMNQRFREINSSYIERLVKEGEELIRFNRELEIKVKEKTEELREKDLQLLEMDRIAGIATLAAGIAHEINNPLSFVKSSIGFVKKSVDKMVGTAKYWDDKPLPEALMKDYKEHLTQINFDYLSNTLGEKFDKIKKGIERIMKIVNSLRSFSRVDREDRGQTDINRSIEEAIEILKPQDLENVEFVKDLQEVPLIECFTKEINQCLLHAIKNAIDAVDGKGIIKITSSYNEKDGLARIKIVDNGKGMSPEVLRQAFTPFFTTKPVGSGTGVGLSLIEKIIKRHGGKIDLSSKEDEGTTLTMDLPVSGEMIKEEH